MNYFLAEVKTKLYETFYANKVMINLNRPIFTFTFDDVPISAIINGLPILDKFDIRGTFYISSKLGETDISEDRLLNEKDKYVTLDIADDLYQKGHHIGCHTYSHYSLSESSVKEITQDCMYNRHSLSKALGGISIDHFAYPFGMVNFKAKKILQKSYKTLRSTRPGINSARVDLNLLKAVRIYSNSLDRKGIAKLIATNRDIYGWLIFYTHGVDNNPDSFGTTPEDLSWIIEECSKTDGELLSIEQAYQNLNCS